MALESLISFVKKMVPFIGKSSIEEDLNMKIKSFDECVNMAYSSYASSLGENFVSPVNVALNNKFYKLNKLPKSGPKNFIYQIKSNLTNFRTNLSTIKELVKTSLETNTATGFAPVKKAAILKAVSEMTDNVDFFLPLLNYVVDCEMMTACRNPTWRPLVIQEEKVHNKFDKFVACLNVYCLDPRAFKNAFDSLPDITVDEKNAVAVGKLSKNKALSILNTGAAAIRGFLGNPIYHFRMNSVENEVEHYRCNKELRDCLQLKVMRLSEDNRNNPDPELEKEIEYLNEEIASLQYQIDEMEKGD